MAKIKRSTTPCNSGFPVLRERMITNRESRKSTVELAPIPRDSGNPVKSETKETVGIVNPILAKAEPSERLRLFCY